MERELLLSLVEVTIMLTCWDLSPIKEESMDPTEGMGEHPSKWSAVTSVEYMEGHLTGWIALDSTAIIHDHTFQQ